MGKKSRLFHFLFCASQEGLRVGGAGGLIGSNVPLNEVFLRLMVSLSFVPSDRRLVGEGKEEATYAEPVLDGKNGSNVMGPGPHHQPEHQETTMFHFAQPYGRDLYR